MTSVKETVLKNVIKVGVFATLFIPFIVTDSLYFPFITGKNFVFRIIVELLLVAWVWLALNNKRYWPKKSAVLWAALAFFGAILVATIFSINPFKSLWSNAERMEGLFGLLHVLAFFVITASVFNTKDWIQFFVASLVASVGVALHGLGQGLGILETNRGDRVDANFGNSTYLAMYVIFHFFFALYLITRVRAREYVPFGSDWGTVLQWGLGILAVLHIVVLWLTNTRGAILGLLGGLFLVALLIVIFSKKGARVRRWGTAGLAVIILIPILFFAFKSTAFVQETPVLNRFASISLTEQTTESRITIWGMTVEAWKDKPLTGWGPGNFTTVFADYYVPKLWKQEPWFDRPHNVSLQWLVSTGIIGFVAYHALFVVALWYVWKLYKRKKFSALQGALFVGLLAAYFIHNFFVFDNVVSYLLFFGVLGWLHHCVAEARDSGPLIRGGMARNFVAALVALAVLFSLYAYNVKPIKAASAVLDALQNMAVPQLGTENIDNARAGFERAIGFGTFITTEAREQLVTKGTDVSQARLAGAQARRDYISYAKEQGEVHLERYPRDRRMRTFLASLYVQTSEFSAGEEHAQYLVDVAPTRPLFRLMLGEALMNQEQYEAALRQFERAFELTPDQPQAAEGLAMGLIRAGRLQRGQAFMQEQYDTAYPPLPRIIQAYISIDAFEAAILAAENLVEKEPQDIRWRFSLAKLYVHEFRDAAAIAELQRIIELEPRLEGQMQDLIGQIRNGTINRSLN